MKATSRGIQFIKSQRRTHSFHDGVEKLDRDVAETNRIRPGRVPCGLRTDDSAVLNAVEMAKFQTRIHKLIVLDQIRDLEELCPKARDELLPVLRRKNQPEQDFDEASAGDYLKILVNVASTMFMSRWVEI